MKLASALLVGMLLFVASVAQGASTVSAWAPIFQGIDQATGTNEDVMSILSANALRIDLRDPDVRLMTTPPIPNNYIPDQRETVLQTPREFAIEFGLQVAINWGFFHPPGYFSPSGTPAWLEGLAISQGRLVSAQMANGQTDSNNCLSSMLFTTNNHATFLNINWPATNTSGIYNALSGLYPLLSNGMNVAYHYTNFLSEEIHQRQPRTAFGLSQDGRYLFMLVIDGRQGSLGFSDGALDWETAEFLQLFGAWNGMLVDGGGSTCMVKADQCGNPVDINHNSYQLAVGRPGSQRPVGANFGVYAKSLPQTGFIQNFSVVAGNNTATFLWETTAPATAQVEYGLTVGLGDSSPLNPSPLTRHVVTVVGLAPQTNYYYRLLSMVGTEVHSFECQFTTSTSPTATSLIFDVTQSWSWTDSNLDGVNWKASDYDDFEWPGAGPGLLYVENTETVSPRNTPMENGGMIYSFPGTHYFRTHFNFSGSTAGGSLIFSNYLDDAAAYYLNGTEVKRLWLPAAPTPIAHATLALAPGGCGGDASCAQLFTTPATALIQGDNVLAVEVHNRLNSQDLVFGMGLIVSRPVEPPPKLNIITADNAVTLWWNGTGFALQRADRFSPGTNNWIDVSGPVATSPYVIANPAGTAFYQLRR